MEKIIFKEDFLPFSVISQNERFKICTRPLNKRWDKDLLKLKVECDEFKNLKEAYNHLKQFPVYTVVDLKENIRGADNLTLESIDYSKKGDCDKLLNKLISWEVEISRRNRIKLVIKKKIVSNY